MQFYNRLTGQTNKALPAQALLGQWQIITETESATINAIPISPHSRIYIFPDATKRYLLHLPNGTRKEQVFPDWQALSEILLESIRFFEQKRQTLIERGDLWEAWVNTSPLVHDIREAICLQPLEELIKKQIGHLEEICHRPRTYLKMESERLPVSRAQRISPHAVEFLAARTEDWEKRTIHNIRPKRVLCLLREDLLDIYENKVTARLIDRLLEYLQKRILAVQALQKELEQANDFSKDTQNIYWRNRNRLCSLWGEQFQAETALNTAKETLNVLQQLRYKLKGLLNTELYQAIPKHSDVGSTLKRTNILINDRHYHHIERLWEASSPWKRRQMKNTQQLFDAYQEVFRGFESFCLLLISRTLTGNKKENDKGMEFEASNLRIPQPGDFIEFSSCRGNIILNWQQDGVFLLESERIQSLKIIPLLLPLSATSDEAIVGYILNELQSNFSSNKGGQIIVLYPGTEDERQKLPLLLQQQISNLGNEYPIERRTLAILPISPLEIISVERVARAIQWWFYSQHYQNYPFVIQENIHSSLLEQSQWILQKGRQYKLHRPLHPDEENLFHNCLDTLINQVKSQKLVAKEKMDKLQQLESLPAKAKEQFKPLLICSVCHSKNSRFTALDSQCFLCECNSCKSRWGTRICKSCSTIYPYLQVSGLDKINPSNHQHLNCIEQVIGRDILAIPDWNNDNIINFICPSCGTSS